MCDTEVNHSIVLIYSILDLLPRLFSADTENLGGELYCFLQGSGLKMSSTQTEVYKFYCWVFCSVAD